MASIFKTDADYRQDAYRFAIRLMTRVYREQKRTDLRGDVANDPEYVGKIIDLLEGYSNLEGISFRKVFEIANRIMAMRNEVDGHMVYIWQDYLRWVMFR